MGKGTLTLQRVKMTLTIYDDVVIYSPKEGMMSTSYEFERKDWDSKVGSDAEDGTEIKYDVVEGPSTTPTPADPLMPAPSGGFEKQRAVCRILTVSRKFLLFRALRQRRLDNKNADTVFLRHTMVSHKNASGDSHHDLRQCLGSWLAATVSMKSLRSLRQSFSSTCAVQFITNKNGDVVMGSPYSTIRGIHVAPSPVRIAEESFKAIKIPRDVHHFIAAGYGDDVCLRGEVIIKDGCKWIRPVIVSMTDPIINVHINAAALTGSDERLSRHAIEYPSQLIEVHGTKGAIVAYHSITIHGMVTGSPSIGSSLPLKHGTLTTIKTSTKAEYFMGEPQNNDTIYVHHDRLKHAEWKWSIRTHVRSKADAIATSLRHANNAFASKYKPPVAVPIDGPIGPIRTDGGMGIDTIASNTRMVTGCKMTKGHLCFHIVVVSLLAMVYAYLQSTSILATLLIVSAPLMIECSRELHAAMM